MTARIFYLPTARSGWTTRPTALLTPESRAILREVVGNLGDIEPWTVEATEQAVRMFAEQRGIKLGAVAQPMRGALTGRTTSPGIFEVLTVLGKAESLARLGDQDGADGSSHVADHGRLQSRLAEVTIQPIFLQCTLPCATAIGPD